MSVLAMQQAGASAVELPAGVEQWMTTLNEWCRLPLETLFPDTYTFLPSVHEMGRLRGMECTAGSRSAQLFVQYRANHHYIPDS